MSSVTRTYFMLTVTDMARAVTFYREVLGPVVRTESETWTEIKLGEATVALHASDQPNPRYTGLGVEVDDLTAAYYAILRTGGQVLTGPHTDPIGQLFYEVADTEGNTFTISGPPPVTPTTPPAPAPEAVPPTPPPFAGSPAEDPQP